MSDEQDVLDVFDALYETACIQRDAAGALALFVDDDLFFHGSGPNELARDRDGLRAILDRIAGHAVNLRFSWDTRAVHVVGDVAWITAVGHVAMDDTEAPYRTTGVFLRRAGVWRWQTHAGSVPVED